MEIVMSTEDITDKYKSLVFCCPEMGDLFMGNFVFSYPHTDHFPRFYMKVQHVSKEFDMDVYLDFCPYCGEKVKGSYTKN